MYSFVVTESLVQEFELERKARQQQQVDRDVKSPLQGEYFL